MIANPLLVMKFGGNCLNTPENSAQAATTVSRLSESVQPVVVVSAPGRAGSPYATDTLLGLADQEGLAGDAAEVDALIASGEIISAALFALRLQGLGLRARSLTGAQAGLITDGAWGRARIIGVDPDPLLDMAGDGIVPVVAGFQGAYQGRLATLGRGGSDLTAVALGAALDAPVTIFTDVDGVYTADPQLIADASRLPALSYEDSALLSYRGAKVLHPRASEMALAHQVDVTVGRPDSPDAGTRITGAEVADRINREISEPLLIGGVTSQGGRSAYALDLSSRDPSELFGMTDRLFCRLAEAGISLDMISVEESSVRFTVDDEDGESTGEVIAQLGLDATRSEPSSRVSIVGGGMHGRPGVMARVVSALYDRQIPILQSSDSHNVISCLVPSEREHEAVEALHDAFFGPAADEGQE
jgi:aspartate kinase